MTKFSIVLVGVLALGGVGCKKKAGGADCDKAIHHSMELSKAEMSKMPGVDDKMMAKMVDVGIEHCNADKWSDDAKKCMADAKTMADAQGCYGKLTQEQRDKMNKAAMELATPPADTTGSGAPAQGSQGSAELASGAEPAGSAAAGSAAADGSAAGSGSAAAPK